MTTSTIRRTAAVAVLTGALALSPVRAALSAQASDTAARTTTTQTTGYGTTDRDGDDHGKWGLAGLLGLLGLLGMRRREPDRVVETRTTTDPNYRDPNVRR